MAERILDFFTQGSTRVWMRSDCDGSQTCVAELHLEYYDKNIEAHLTYEECQHIRKALKRAMKAHKETGAQDNGTDH